MGPSALRVAGLGKKLSALGYQVTDKGNIPVPQAESLPAEGPSEARFLPQIAQSCEILAHLVQEALANHQFPIVLGGDH